MKSRGGKSQRREEKRREEERISKQRKSQKKEDPGARKGSKVAKHCVFPMICGSGGSKSRLAKAAGAEPAGQMRDEKLHAIVARSTFPKSNCTKHLGLGALLAVEMSKKCTPLWREAHFEVNMLKTHKAPGVRTTFGRSDVVSRGRRKGLCTLSKVSKTWGFCSISIFDVVNFEKWGSVAELFRFWCCQLRKVRKSRRIALFSSLQIDRQTDR